MRIHALWTVIKEPHKQSQICLLTSDSLKRGSAKRWLGQTGPALPATEPPWAGNVVLPPHCLPRLRKLNKSAWPHPAKTVLRSLCRTCSERELQHLPVGPRWARPRCERNPGLQRCCVEQRRAEATFTITETATLRGNGVRLALTRRCRFSKCRRTFWEIETEIRSTRQCSLNQKQNLQEVLKIKY